MKPVGRARELAQIARILAAVDKGFAPKVVLLEGAAGLGKSTLLGAACEAAAGDGWFVVHTVCHAVQSDLPLSAMRAILREVLERLGEDRARYASGLEAVTGMGAASETAAKGVLRLLEGVSFDYKVLLAIDDAQWADFDSLQTLAEITIALAERRLAILVAKRPETSDASLPFAVEASVPVLPLGDADAAAVVREIAPLANEAVVLEAMRHAGGHPLDLVALARAIARDAIASPDDLAANRRTLIARDVRAEPPDLREFLQLCSLIDGCIERRVLAQLWPDGDALDGLIARASGRYVQSDGSQVSFVHSLIAEGVRETIAVQTPYRRRLIAAIERVEDRMPEDYELLADQLCACGDRAAAFATLAELAKQAASRRATRLRASAAARALHYGEPPQESAPAFYSDYADALFELDRDAEAAAMSETALERLARFGAGVPGNLVARLVLSQLFSDQQENARISYRRFADLVRDPADRAMAQSAALWFSLTDGETAQTREIESAIDALGDALPPTVRIRAAGFTAFRKALDGNYAAAAELLERARLLAEESRTEAVSPLRFGVIIPSMFVNLFEFGTRAMSAYLDRWKDPALDITHVDVLRTLATFLEERWNASEALVGAALERAPAAANRRRLLAIAAAVGALRGTPSEHQAAIDSEIGLFLDVQCRGGGAPLCVWWAASPWAERRAARTILRSVVDRLRVPCDLGLDMPTYMPKLALVAAAHRLQDEDTLRAIAAGQLWSPRTPWHAAHERAAIAVAKALLNEPVRDVASTIADCDGLGLSLYADLLRVATSTDAVEANARLVDLGVTWLTEAKAEKKLATRPTARELQVAEFIASGKTNREIADALVLSLRTVEAHIANLFNKLGVTSRTQVVAWHYRFRESG